MSKPFESFRAELNFLQVSLLLDTVLYFEEAPKLLSIPSSQGAVAVPLLPDTLKVMLAGLSEEEPIVKSSFSFSFEWVDESAKLGVVHVSLPNGKVEEQQTNLALFSAV